MAGHEGVDVGDQIGVRLTGLNIERGFIDFARTGNEGRRRAISEKSSPFVANVYHRHAGMTL